MPFIAVVVNKSGPELPVNAYYWIMMMILIVFILVSFECGF